MPRQTKTIQEKIAGYIRPRTMPGTLIHDPETEKTKARFSRVYKPAGLNFVKAYEVIYLVYWLKYRLIGYAEVNLYNFLNCLAENDMAFTIRGLAHEMKCGQTQIVVMLDKLENARLIHRLKLADVHGQPNYIVMCTPHIENPKALTQKVKKRIADAGESLPTVFLDDVIEELRKAETVNLAKQRRDYPEAHPEHEGRTRTWNEALHAFDGDFKTTLAFDNIIADLCVSHPTAPLDAFNKMLKNACERAQIDLTAQLRVTAHNIRAFYDSYQRPPRPSGKQLISTGLQEAISELRYLLDSGAYTIEQITVQFKNSFSAADWTKVERALTT